MIFPKRESNPEVLAKLVERIKVTDSNTSNDVSLLVGVLEQVKAAAAAGEALVLGPNAVHNLWTAVQALGSVHETESKHPCDDGLRTATCPGCDGKGCDYCNEGVQLVRARQETESKPAPQCIWRTGCKNHRLCDEMGCCQQLGQQQNGKSSHP